MSDALKDFDPNGPGLVDNNIFGLPFSEEASKVILLPVPWEVTVSYRPGTSKGPEQVFDASLQVDLFDPDYKDIWKQGFYMLPVSEEIKAMSEHLRGNVEEILEGLYNGVEVAEDERLSMLMQGVNEGGKYCYDWVYEQALKQLKKGKKVGLIGGDHSTPLGLIKAVGQMHESFGLLHIDAHSDLRDAYEGFTYSHASIMFNVLKEVPQVSKLVQVGVRDYCDEELEVINNSNERVQTFFDKDIKEAQYRKLSWDQIADEIVEELPQKIYISFDIDGLDPKLCPNTGTPVPGGFETDQVYYLMKKIYAVGIEVIGFDLNEVSTGRHQADDCIDPIVGARVLYKLCNLLAATTSK